MNAPVKSLDLSFSNRPDAAGPIPLAGLTRAQLRDALIEHAGVEEKKAKMRAEQLWRWIYHYGVQSFDEMTNVSKDLRKVLEEKFTLARAEIVERLVSVDGTRKYLIRFAPGVEAETVFIPDVGKSGALVRVQPGGLHAQLHLLPYRHAKAGAQSHGG
jgi:23S rRNA (adenine2503-C2)-methyltransferase